MCVRNPSRSANDRLQDTLRPFRERLRLLASLSTPRCCGRAHLRREFQSPLYAPDGVNIYSTVPSQWIHTGRYGGWQPIPQYDYYSGTSMTTPQVSGLAGLILSKNPELTNTQVRYKIEHTAVDLGDPGKDPVFGWGRIDACAALNSCKIAVNPG